MNNTLQPKNVTSMLSLEAATTLTQDTSNKISNSPPLDQVVKEAIVFRIIVTIAIMFYPSLELAPWTKILLILFMDAFKNVYILIRRPDLVPGSLSNHKLYQQSDKVLDILSYWLCMYLIQKNNLLIGYESRVLLIALIYRTIGATIAVVSNETYILLYFPDVFKEFLLVFWALQGQQQALAIVLLIVAVISKVYLEYIYHVKKEGGTRITKYFVIGFMLVASLRWVNQSQPNDKKLKEQSDINDSV